MKSGWPLLQCKLRWPGGGVPCVWQALALVLLAFAALEMGGCGMGTTELPATTQPGGPGFLSITTPQLSDGVAALPYTATINTTGGSNTLAACTVISGALPPGFVPPEPQGSSCILTSKGQPVGASGHFTFTLQAGDTSTPQRTDNHVYTLTIRPEFTINPPAILDGIAGRSYTRTFTLTTNLVNHAPGQVTAGSTEAGNGPATACAISGLPGAVAASCAIDASQVNTTITMRAGGGTLAAGTYPFSISVTDSPIPASNQTVAAVPAGTVTLPLNLVVRPEFAITQAALADGVQGRTYGVSPLAQPVATDLSATALSESGEPTEAGNGPITGCALSVAASNPGLTVAPSQNNCLLESVSPVATAPTYGAQSFSVTVSATDNPIKDPASGQIVVPANTITKTLPWTAQAPIAYSLNFDTSAGQPGQVPDAVQNRTYGSPPKSALEATAIGGLSNETGATITESGALPAGIACANGAPNPTPVLICGSSGAPVTSSAGSVSFAITAADPGNTATPAGSSSTDLNQHASHALKVDAPLALAANFGSPLPQAVLNQSYGASPLVPLQYTASGGLGGYVFTTVTGQASPGAGFPAGIACAQGTGAAANAFSCATPSGGVITAGANAATPYTPTVTLDDTANGTTPDGAASGTGTSQTSSLTVNPPLTITASGAAAPAPPPGVVGRAYGVGGGLQALIYSISGGIPPYTLTAINSTGAPSSDGVPAPMTCSGTPNPPTQMVCESASGLAANAGTYPFTVSVHDAGTASDPVSTTSLAQSVVVNAAMTLTPATTTPPLSVIGRTYGAGSNCGASGTAACAPIVYNISGGLGGYSPTPTISGFPGTFACPLSASGLSGTYSCSTSSAVTGTSPATLSLTASDTANTATPAGTLTSNTVSLNIAQPLTLTLTSGAPPTSVFGRAYATGSGCSGGTCAPVVYTIANGTGIYPAAASLTTAAGSFSCALSGSAYNCSSASITLNPGAAPATESLNVSVADVANASTPSASVSNNLATLTVDPALNIAGPSGTLAVAVDGRTYGAGATCGAGGATTCATIGYTVTGGLGGYSTAPTLNLYPTTFACPFTSTGSLSGAYTCSSAGGVTGSGSPSVSITASDTANTSAPTASATSNTATLPISPALSITPPTTVNPAVQGRVYGQGAGCSGGACAPLPYVISGGTTVYSTTAVSLTSAAGTFSCTLVSTTYNCSSTDITGPTGGNTLNFSASDVADASTPAATPAPTDSSKSIVVNAPLALNLTSGAPATAVAGRAYGTGTGCTDTGGACAPITYSVANGLGGYTSPVTMVGSPTTINGLVCTLSGTTYTCVASPLGPSTLSLTNDSLTITISDTSNASTPSTTVSNSPTSLTIDPAMTIAKATGQGTTAATAVVGSSYGSGSVCGVSGTAACAPIQYTVAGGLGNYATTASLSESPTALTGLSCPLSGSTYSCSSASLGPGSLSSPATDTLSITTSETGDASTPGATTPADTSVTLPVNPVLALNITPGPISNGTAVTGRTYGTAAAPNCSGSAACVPLVFTASFGTGTGYTFTDASPLTTKGFACATAATTYSCTSSNVTATAAISLNGVSLKDTADASAPAAPTPLSIATSLPVNAALSLPASPVPMNALLGYTYSPFFTLTAQAGLSSVGIASWSVYAPATPPPSLPCPTNNASLLNGFSLDTTTGIISGTPTTAGSTTFDACAADDPDATTPAGPGASGDPPNYSFTVVNPYAYIIDPGTTSVEVIDTGAGASGTPAYPGNSVGSLTLTSPQGVAVTEDGLEAVVIVSTNKLEVISTASAGNTPVAGSPFSLAAGNTCTTAKGIAISGTTGYLLCDNGASASDVYVLPLTGLAGSTITPTSAISLGANTLPVAIAVSKDGSTVVVAEATTPTPGLQIIKTSNGALSPLVDLTGSTTPVAVTIATYGSNLDAFIAETKASNPGQVDVVSINTTSFVGTPGTAITFNPVSGTNPEPSCIAATPDGARIYVGLTATDQFGEIDNTVATPALLHQLSLPALSSTAVGVDSPGGVAIPPLNPLPVGTGYRVFFPVTGVGSGGVVVLNDNGGTTAPTFNTSFVLAVAATPEGIAIIPVPK